VVYEVYVIIRIRKSGATTVLDLDGPLMVGDSELAFRNKIQELLDQGSRKLAINLAGVSDVDSWGLGALVRHCAQVRRAGGRCIFFAPTERVLRLLETTHLGLVLDIAQNEAEAVSRV
jgi:anti-sigma B factor antagonist